TQEYKILPQIEDEGLYEFEKPRTFCVPCLVLIFLIFILSGVAAICVSFWWSKELHQALDQYWPGHPNLTAAFAHFDNNNDTSTSGALHNFTFNSSEESTENSYFNATIAFTEGHNGTNVTRNAEINENNIGTKFAEAMREFEKQMETLSGIHQAELVIPIFMLVSFISMLALISLCCCFMSKQREKRQRKLLAKVITDLQTGDSKTFLLGNKEDDF
ncbi:unnamed protein product, partial [Allacma fusca]